MSNEDALGVICLGPPCSRSTGAAVALAVFLEDMSRGCNQESSVREGDSDSYIQY